MRYKPISLAAIYLLVIIILLLSVYAIAHDIKKDDIKTISETLHNSQILKILEDDELNSSDENYEHYDLEQDSIKFNMIVGREPVIVDGEWDGKQYTTFISDNYLEKVIESKAGELIKQVETLEIEKEGQEIVQFNIAENKLDKLIEELKKIKNEVYIQGYEQAQDEVRRVFNCQYAANCNILIHTYKETDEQKDKPVDTLNIIDVLKL